MIVCVYENFSELPDEAIPELLKSLPEFRSQKASSYRFPEDIKSSALSYLMLESILGFQPVFYYNEFGKPFIDAADAPCFSISHSEHAIAVAVSYRSPVGIDVEQHASLARLQGLSIQDKVFSAGERSIPDKLVKFWTLKECRLKCIGMGLGAENPEDQDFSEYANKRTFAMKGRSYFSDSYDEFWLSLCCKGEPGHLKLIDYHWSR
jgi:phosphopantetheinyl transferase